MRLFFVLLFFPLSAFGFTCEPLADYASQSIRKIAVFQPDESYNIGTAWKVAPGIWFTAAHVVGSGTTAVDPDQRQYKVEYTDGEADIAILSTTPDDSRKLNLGTNITFGDQVWNAGYFGDSHKLTISTGFTLNTRFRSTSLVGIRLFSYSATGYFGGSGGPVLYCQDNEWKVVGMLIGISSVPDRLFTELCVGVPVIYLKEALDGIVVTTR